MRCPFPNCPNEGIHETGLWSPVCQKHFEKIIEDAKREKMERDIEMAKPLCSVRGCSNRKIIGNYYCEFHLQEGEEELMRKFNEILELDKNGKQ